MTRSMNMLRSPSGTHSRRFGVKSIPLQCRAVANGAGSVGLDGTIDASDQTAFGCDLYGAVTEHLDRIPAFTGPIHQYGNDRPSGMIAECLIDLVANCELGIHENPPACRLCVQSGLSEASLRSIRWPAADIGAVPAEDRR